MLFVGFKDFSDAARFLDPLTQQIVITQDYVVPTFEVGPNGVTIHKDVKTLPCEVTAAPVENPVVETVRLPIRGRKSLSDSLAPVPGWFQSPMPNLEQPDLSSDPDDSDDNESDVSFETEARRVLERNLNRCCQANSANRTVESVRPTNINVSKSPWAPNQGCHFSFPASALNRLQPSWEWADANQRPPNEIRGNVDESNIVSTRRRLVVRLPGGLDKQPDVVNLVESVKVNDALASELERPLWLEAMRTEHASQLLHFTGDLVPAPKDEKIIGGMWVLSRKLNEAGEVIRHKACWVGFGNHQEPMKHYYDTYASVGRIETFKVLLSMSVTYQWPVFQFDVETAFLHGEMDAEVYVRQVLGFEVPGKENWVWKLNKLLYGMKKAPCMWKNHLTTTLRNLGLTPSIMDDALFFNANRTIYLHIYVDDGRIVGQNPIAIKNFSLGYKNCIKSK
jgi:hypothetical protein